MTNNSIQVSSINIPRRIKQFGGFSTALCRSRYSDWLTANWDVLISTQHRRCLLDVQNKLNCDHDIIQGRGSGDQRPLQYQIGFCQVI